MQTVAILLSICIVLQAGESLFRFLDSRHSRQTDAAEN
jgi:hypothetical protein